MANSYSFSSGLSVLETNDAAPSISKMISFDGEYSEKSVGSISIAGAANSDLPFGGVTSADLVVLKVSAEATITTGTNTDTQTISGLFVLQGSVTAVNVANPGTGALVAEWWIFGA